MDSNNESRNETARNVVEQVDVEIEDEESGEHLDRVQAQQFVFDAEYEYNLLLSDLCACYSMEMAIGNEDLLNHILGNIDKFCKALSRSTCVTAISFGRREWCGSNARATGTRFRVPTESAAAWEELLSALGRIPTVYKLTMDGHCMSCSDMSKVVEAMPQVAQISLHFPWRATVDEDVNGLVEALRLSPCKGVSLACSSDGSATNVTTQNNDNPIGHPLSELFRLGSLRNLTFEAINFSEDECNALRHVLTSDTCCIEDLSLADCSLLDGQVVAKGFASNTSLKRISLSRVFGGKSFCDELIASLPLNCSIESATFYTCGAPHDMLDVVQLVKSTTRHNKTLKSMHFATSSRNFLSEIDTSEMKQAIQQNYSLERIALNGKEPFRAITNLNRNGRRYLSHDASTPSKCIAVLNNVKHDLDCLYFHMRENPILCLNYCD